MPCNSDYLNPTRRERELQRAAQLLAYALMATGQGVPEEVNRAGADIYCRDDSWLLSLCALMKALPEAERDRITYGSAKLKQARDLADWWEEHQKADAAREKQESVRDNYR